MRIILIVCLLMLSAAVGRAETPTQAQIDGITAVLKGDDSVAIDGAVKQIDAWITSGWVGRDIFARGSAAGWLLTLRDKGRHQDVADLSLKGLLNRPAPEAVSLLMELRFNALLALNRPEEALMAAKSYYNVCNMNPRYISGAVRYVADAWTRAHPEDAQLARDFTLAQTRLNTATSQPAIPQSQVNQPLLKRITIDVAPYQQGLVIWASRTGFKDRVGYANLLLIADKTAEAEKEFRALLAIAKAPDEKSAAAEGVAKAMRAADSNAGRGLAWMASPEVQQITAAAVAAATRPAATTRAATRDTGLP